MKRVALHGFLSLLALSTLTPLWIMFVTSFKTTHGMLGLKGIFPDLHALGWSNYVNVWTDGNFGRYFFNSAFVTFCIVCGNVLFDSMAAYALSRREFSLKKALLGIIVAKLMIPSAVLMVPTFILMRNLGFYDTYFALILPMLAETFGIFLLRQYMLSLPKSLEEAARLEGAGDLRVFFTVVLPLCKPVLSVVVIHSVMNSWNMYVYPLILTSSDSMRTLPLGLAFYRSSHAGIDSGHLMAGSMITAFPVIAVFLFFQKQIIRGLTSGAVKE